MTGSSSFPVSPLCSDVITCNYSLVWTNTESRVLDVELYMEGWVFSIAKILINSGMDSVELYIEWSCSIDSWTWIDRAW